MTSLRSRRLRTLVVAMLGLLAPAALGAERPAAPPPAFVPGSWTLVLLPDTQGYSESYPGLFTLQTHWIAKNKDKYNIRYVLHLGDITNCNTDREWQCAREAMNELDGKVPYAMVPGNHDKWFAAKSDRTAGQTGLNKYFEAAKYRTWPTFGGLMQEGDMSNNYHLFTAGGVDWIVIALDWAPRDAVVQWANDVLAKHPQRKAILLTHVYLCADHTRFDFAKKGDSQQYTPHHGGEKNLNDGEELWQKLVRKNDFAMTFNGHVTGAGVVVDTNSRGKKVYQMGVDYQWMNLGGEGYLRILEFLPDGKTVHVKSYSPLHDKYLSDPGNQFTFQLDL